MTFPQYFRCKLTFNAMTPKRLYRSTSNRVVGGVAAGLANYFNLDPLLVRLLFVIFTVVGGGAVGTAQGRPRALSGAGRGPRERL